MAKPGSRRHLAILTLAGVGGGLALSALAAPHSLAQVLGLLVGGAAVAAMLWYPPLTLVVFWAAYALLTTVFSKFNTWQGFYYPIYLVMGLNAALSFFRPKGTLIIPWKVVAGYLAFYALATLGLVWSPSLLSTNSTQRLFIYGLGLMAATQIQTEKQQDFVFSGFWLTGIAIALWTDRVADTGELSHRGNLDINPNYVATFVATAALFLSAQLLGGARRGWLIDLARLVGIGICLYANLLLASRGTSVALALGFGAIWVLMARREPRRAHRVALLGGVLVIGLLALPGASNMGERFDENNTDTLNDRLPVWEHGLREFGESSVGEMLLGKGTGASEEVARSVSPSIGSMHNAFLQILLEYGQVGLVGFLAFVAACFASAQQHEPVRRALVVGGLVFAVVQCLSASSTDDFSFWAFLGSLIPSPRFHGHHATSVLAPQVAVSGEAAA